MKKFFKVLFIIIISIAILCGVIVLWDIHVMSPEHVRLNSVRVDDSSVSFSFDDNIPPSTMYGYSLQRYKFELILLHDKKIDK